MTSTAAGYEGNRRAENPGLVQMIDRPEGRSQTPLGGQSHLSSDISRFSSIVDYATDGIVVIDSDGVIQYANGAALSMFGRDQTELVGHVFGHPLTVDGATELELVDPKDPQQVRFVELRSVQTHWDGNVATLMTMRDTSDRHEAELELIKINSWLSRSMADIEAVARYVAHDVLQPIATLHQCLAVLEEASPDEAEVRHLLEIARLSLNAISDPVEGLLEYSRSGSAPLRLEQVDCRDLVQECRGAMSGEPGTIRIGWLPIVVSDRRLLRQVFQNLMINAVRHGRSERQPHVAVSADPMGESWLFSVTDDGPGVPEELRERIFDPFWSAAPESAGAGLGLAAAKRAVARLGGGIWVDAPTGGGSQFCFTVPFASP